MSENFYRAFEDRYRGARDVIKARLMAYQPFLTPLFARYPGSAALDLGCGRGEWLELLGELGFAARGVDLDEGMLEACRERGLDTELTDALSALRAQPDASLALVSAFHLVEHIAFDQVQQLIAESLRVLLPGGLLIMETPNAENLVVGASSFYMDPSHLKPIPSALLGFVVDHSGFGRHALLRLQENRALHDGGPIGLIDVLDGVSPDYAIVGQSAAPDDVLAPFADAFGARYGISLSDLALRFEKQEAARNAEVHHLIERVDLRTGADTRNLLDSLDAAHKGVARVADGVENNGVRIGLIDSSVQQLGARVSIVRDELAHESGLGLQRVQTELRAEFAPQLQLLVQRLDAGDARSAQLEARSAQLEARSAQLEARAAVSEAQAAQAETRAAQAEHEAAAQRRHVAELLASSSWRVTAPLRAGADVVHTSVRVGRRLRAAQREGRIGGAVKRRAAGPLLGVMRRLLRYPRVKRTALALLKNFPGLHARLYRLLRRGVVAPQAAPVPPQGVQGAMSARTRQAYEELQQAIKGKE